MLDYTNYHFAREEEFMQKNGYPGYAEHKKQHEALIERAKLHMENFEMGKSNFEPVVLLDFLSQWLMRHILHEDRKYKSSMKED